MSPSRLIRLLLLLLLPCGILLAPGQAHAAVWCSVTQAPDINFGTVDPLNGGAQNTGTASWTCYNSDNKDAYVTLCLNIGAGTGGTQGVNRQMLGGSGQPLQFQLYQDAAHAQVWGSLLSSTIPNPYQTQFIVPKRPNKNNVGSYNGTARLYGVVPTNQTGVTSGSYSSAFYGTDAMLSGTYDQSRNGYPASCGSYNAGNFNFTVSANVTNSCTVTASDLDFGATSGLMTANVDATTKIQTQCTNGTSYQIGLNDGLNASGNTRRMSGGGADWVTYELYRDAGRTQRWGNTVNSDTVTGTGNGLKQDTTVYGRVPPQPGPTPGNYLDTITVNVYY